MLPNFGANLTVLFAAEAPKHLPYYWHLPILIVLVSLVYSAARHDEWRHIFTEAFRWMMRLSVFLLMVAVALYVLSRFV